MKKALAAALSIIMLLGLVGCGGENGGDSVFNAAFSAKDAIRIEDIDWNVSDGIIDGERFVSFNYTNNSKYTILDVEMKFVQRENISAEQLSVFNNLKEEMEWTDEELSDVYILGYNRKCANPGETVTDSPCCINGTYTLVENMKQYEIMEPDMATIAFIGNDGKGYAIYYDFKSQTYGESSQGGKDLHKWSDSEISKLLPKVEAPAIDVGYDDEDYFSFSAFGVSWDDYEAYVKAVKSKGFTEVEYDSNTSYCATNSDGFEVYITYTAVEETMTVRVEQE